MMFAHGCSMSTAGIYLLVELLMAHGVQPAPGGHHEFIKKLLDVDTLAEAQKMGFGKHLDPQVVNTVARESDLRLKFEHLLNWTHHWDETLVFKYELALAQEQQAFTKYLVSLGTRAFQYRRWNLVDTIICELTDFCTDHVGARKGKNVDANGTEIPCEGFRGRGAREKHRKPKVMLYPDRILGELENQEKTDREHSHFLGKSGFQGDLTAFAAEKLLAFEYDADHLDESADHWTRLLTQVGVKPHREAILATLRKWGTFAAPSSHKETVYNFDEIAAKLKGTRYYDMLRM